MIDRIVLAIGLSACAIAQPLRSLKTVTVPAMPGLDAYVRDNDALIALGKTFLWDMQAGSDGRTACATCHFHAGADHRRHNQIADRLNVSRRSVRRARARASPVINPSRLRIYRRPGGGTPLCRRRPRFHRPISDQCENPP